ncbi:MAG: aldo/keto reductase [Gemmatimonadaceae bacterium]
MNRFALGTVQLGMAYGRNRELPMMTEQAAFRILDAAWDIGLRVFDTAEAYGASAPRLRRWIDLRGYADRATVVTKCTLGGASHGAVGTSESAAAALARFSGVHALVLLTHGAAGADDWTAVSTIAARHVTGAGQSVYTPEEVISACRMPGTARVQAPANVLDERALAARTDSPTALDVRSVYLQGVLLESPESAERRVPGSGRIVSALRSTADSQNVDLAPLLVASMLQKLRRGDRVVLGVDDASQLEVIPAAIEIDHDTVRDFDTATSPLRKEAIAESIRDPRAWTVGNGR